MVETFYSDKVILKTYSDGRKKYKYDGKVLGNKQNALQYLMNRFNTIDQIYIINALNNPIEE